MNDKRHPNPDRDKLAKEVIEMLSDKPSEMKPSAEAMGKAKELLHVCVVQYARKQGPDFDFIIGCIAHAIDAYAAEQVRQAKLEEVKLLLSSADRGLWLLAATPNFDPLELLTARIAQLEREQEKP